MYYPDKNGNIEYYPHALSCNCDRIFENHRTEYLGGYYGYKYGCVDIVECQACHQRVIKRERYYD
jgi:hypothetical protein